MRNECLSVSDFGRTDLRGYALSTHDADRYIVIRARGYTSYILTLG